jgi:basic membrane protein A
MMTILLNGCGVKEDPAMPKRLKVGIMLSNDGLGDQSFSDGAFARLTKARDELGIELEYRELADLESFDQGLTELVNEKCDLIVGLGFAVKESLENVAEQFPEQQFILIDDASELPNVASLTFKEDEGSFLVGVVAGMKTRTNTVGFIGGMDVPVINRFGQGFVSGVKAANPKAQVIVEYAGDFGKAEIGSQLAAKMNDEHNVDIIFAAAGYTGVGVLQEELKRGKYAIGVDSDQFFIAEKAVITSMLKNVDVAIYSAVQTFLEEKSFPEKQMVYGLKETGVGMAPIRITSLTAEEEQKLEDIKSKLLSGSITITTRKP